MAGQLAILSHGEIQRIIDDIAETNRCNCVSMPLRITENAEIQTTSDAEETAIQINLSSSFTSNSQYYLSRVSSSLSPGNEFALWGWLQALRATGCLSKVSTELSADHIDLYRQVLSNISTISACAIAKALESARKIVARAQMLGRSLTEFNVLLEASDDYDILAKHLIKCLCLSPARRKIIIQPTNVEKYVEALIEVSVTFDTLTWRIQILLFPIRKIIFIR